MNYILGGGVAGLIYAFYHPEYKILTDKIGGQFATSFQLGPRFLHRTIETDRFLDDLNVRSKYRSRLIKIGFYYQGEIHSSNTEENRIRYFKKTRGLNSFEPYQSSMSNGVETFEAYDIDPNELVDIIYEKIRNNVIIDKIKKVDLISQRISGEYDYIYKDLIVTMPKPIFLKISGYSEEAEKYISYPTTFMLWPESYIRPFKNLEKYDYVYFSQDEFDFHRITKTKEGFVLEMKGEHQTPYKERQIILKIGQIVERKDDHDWPQNIKFFGRYANWDHSVRTETILKQIFSAKI